MIKNKDIYVENFYSQKPMAYTYFAITAFLYIAVPITIYIFRNSDFDISFVLALVLPVLALSYASTCYLRKLLISEKIKKNPIILKIRNDGLHIPYCYERGHPKFIEWKNIINAQEITTLESSAKLKRLHIFYRDEISKEEKQLILPYTIGSFQATNYSKQKIIDMINAAKAESRT